MCCTDHNRFTRKDINIHERLESWYDPDLVAELRLMRKTETPAKDTVTKHDRREVLLFRSTKQKPMPRAAYDPSPIRPPRRVLRQMDSAPCESRLSQRSAKRTPIPKSTTSSTRLMVPRRLFKYEDNSGSPS